MAVCGFIAVFNEYKGTHHFCKQSKVKRCTFTLKPFIHKAMHKM